MGVEKNEHSQDCFVHTNTIENFWSCLKRGIYGTYHKVSEKHIQKYVDEFSYKYNTRKESEQTRFDRTLEQCNGRLKWNELIEKMECNNCGISEKILHN